MARRPDGALEHDILEVLWAEDRSLPPNEVRDRLDCDLAYTTVATVLGRLHDKGLVDRIEGGRAFRYRAAVSEAQLAVRQMSDVLSGVSDRTQVLAGFVGSLSKREAKALRSMLGDNQT
jgi:predicted transcriptional regulator